MNIIIAPDSFKESLSSFEVAKAFESGFKEVIPEANFTKIPIADGGEGTVKALVMATGGQIISTNVIGPLGNEVESFYGVCGDGKTVVIEMAASSGLDLVPKEFRNPLVTTSFGTGQLIKTALDEGFRKFIIGIGGSATNDAGAGMLQALGVKLLDNNGEEIGYGGGSLAKLSTIDLSEIDSRINESTIDVACDVTNPLTGPTGASAVFGPQKGASPQMVEVLDKCLKHFANKVLSDLNKDFENDNGAGAAGGMGYALKGFLNAKLLPGVEIVIEQTNLRELVKDANLVITGEGRIDGQSIFGKAPVGIAKVAKENGVPVIAIAGSLGSDAKVVREHGINAVFSIVNGPCTLEDALENAQENVKSTARNIAEVIRLSNIK